MAIYLVLFVLNGISAIPTVIIVPHLWWLLIFGLGAPIIPLYLIRAYRRGELANLLVLDDGTPTTGPAA
jgi:hypothetical protein